MRKFASVMFALAFIAACDPVPPPGTLVGKFNVLRSLVDNTCGAVAAPAVDPTSYTVEIREDNGRAYWRIDQNPFQDGTITTSGDIYFSASAGTVVEAPDAGVLGCAIVQSETITGHVIRLPDAGVDDGGIDAGVADAGVTTGTPLTAIDTFTFTSTPGSDCSALLTVFGGSFDQLPCTAHFSIVGNR